MLYIKHRTCEVFFVGIRLPVMLLYYSGTAEGPGGGVANEDSSANHFGEGGERKSKESFQKRQAFFRNYVRVALYHPLFFFFPLMVWNFLAFSECVAEPL